jgi:antitoxin (DNA-binding transcriptional repressor) of toxin-antitoxin stability system
MATITLDKAQTDLATLVERALAGEEIVIEMPSAAAVKLSPIQKAPAFDEVTARLRGYGAMKGQLVVGPEFFEPLSDEECGLSSDEKPGS